MRLICPKCEAQYDLEPGLIPPEGREVECSACGHIWFQRARPPLRTPQPVQPGTPPATSAPAPPSSSEVHLGPFEEDEGDEQPAAAPPPRRKLNESLLSVLREEAAREAEARRAEAARFEFQDDLGLDLPSPGPALPPIAPPEPAPPEPALPEPTPPEPALPPEPAPVTVAPDAPAFVTPKALPDPVSLGASLDAPPDPVDDDLGPAAPMPARRSHFWSGFWVAALVWAALVGLYLAAPDLAARWPKAAPALQGVTDMVDQARQALGGLWAAVLQQVSLLTAKLSAL